MEYIDSETIDKCSPIINKIKNSLNDDGQNLIHCIALSKHCSDENIYFKLKSFGISFNLQDKFKNLPLHYIMLNAQYDSIKKTAIELTPKDMLATQNENLETPLHLGLKSISPFFLNLIYL